jgi:hypothetical protein
VRITIEMAGGKLIFSAAPLPSAPTVGAPSLVARGAPPPFIGKGEADYSCVAQF